MGSRGAAQPRKVGQPKPSISSAAQLHSKKERKKERQGKQERRKPRRGRKRNQRPMSPFCLSTKMKVNIHLQHRNWPQNFSMTKMTLIKIFPRQPNRHGCQCPKWHPYCYFSGSQILGRCALGCICLGRNLQ